MATSSITKEFVVRDNETCDRLIKALSEQQPKRKKSNSGKYEEGRRLLEKVREPKRFRGPFYDMLVHDIIDDTWMLVPSGQPASAAIVIGTRNQIMDLYDEYNSGNGDLTL